jgi:hypothetical protein
LESLKEKKKKIGIKAIEEIAELEEKNPQFNFIVFFRWSFERSRQ